MKNKRLELENEMLFKTLGVVAALAIVLLITGIYYGARFLETRPFVDRKCDDFFLASAIIEDYQNGNTDLDGPDEDDIPCNQQLIKLVDAGKI